MNKQASSTEFQLNTALMGNIDPAERKLRIELACAFRLVRHFGWDFMNFNFISARVPGPEGHLLINAFELSFDEICASNLLKIDREGNNVIPSPLHAPKAGLTVLGAIHDAKPEIGSVLHVHSPAAAAVCAMEEGLMMLEQESMIFYGQIGYLSHEGIPIGGSERKRIAAALGDNKHLILRNHGLVTTGRTVAEALVYMCFLQAACENQVAILSTGRKYIKPSEQVASQVPGQFIADQERYGTVGQLSFESMMRRMDRLDPSYRL